MSDGGKGSKQRPTDQDAYSKNYDLIFGNRKKPSNDETETSVADRVKSITPDPEKSDK